jgi:hypothetical protein
MQLAMHRDGQNVVETLPPGQQYLDAIAENFGIHLDAKYEDFIQPGQP